MVTKLDKSAYLIEHSITHIAFACWDLVMTEADYVNLQMQ